jgi:hypothetical protein
VIRVHCVESHPGPIHDNIVTATFTFKPDEKVCVIHRSTGDHGEVAAEDLSKEGHFLCGGPRCKWAIALIESHGG